MNEQFNAKKREFLKESPLSKAGIFIKIALILVILIILILTANSLMQYIKERLSKDCLITDW